MLPVTKNRTIYMLERTGKQFCTFMLCKRPLHWQNKRSHLSQFILFFSFTSKIEIPKHSWKQKQANSIKPFYTDNKIIQNRIFVKMYREKANKINSLYKYHINNINISITLYRL